MVFYACVYQKLAETDCRCKIGRKWRLHDVAVGIPLGAHVSPYTSGYIYVPKLQVSAKA